MKALRFFRLWPIIAFLTLAACQMVYAAPAITVSPASGPPTTGITAQGSGFADYEAMDVYFDTSHLILTVTSETGTFSCTLTAPRSAIPGVHWVTAVGRKSKSAAQKPFTVRTNWSQFHYGPQHRGFNPYENVLSPSTVAGLNEAWRYTTDSWIYSSPAVANGIVYVASRGKLYALDAQTGAFKWSYRLGGGIQSSPAVVNGLIYLGSADGKLYALDAQTGAFKWSYTTGGPICLSCPVVANGIVYVGSVDGKVYALDAQTGALLWSHLVGSWEAFTSPAAANGLVYVICLCALDALDAQTGAFVWRYMADTILNPSSPPVVANGTVYVRSSYGYHAKLHAVDAFTGALSWSYHLGGGIQSPPAAANGILYVSSFSDGKLYALDAQTGAFKWSYALDGPSSPVVANGVVYAGSNDGKLYALGARSGVLLWRANASLYLSSPVVVDGWVYVASQTPKLHAYSLDPGGVYRTIIRRPDPAELIPDLSLQPQVGKGTIESSEEVE